MCQHLAHRGPDGEGFWLSPGRDIALGHRRLAILDLTEASAQPMTDPETGWVLAYNGELYNFVELRQQLEREGQRFRTRGDVEVVLRALVHWGCDAFRRFAGMFAIAAWEPSTRTVWLARDALGMKPLYFSLLKGGAVAFASEAKALIDVPEVGRKLRRVGLAEFVDFGFVLDPRGTVFEKVSRLGPGEVLGFRDGEEVCRFSHWRAPGARARGERGEAERVEELESVLEVTVAQHLVADVPLGILLSGGLDSSLLAALAARGGPVTTVSMGFDRSDLDERGWAEMVAKRIGSRHVELLVDPSEVLRELEDSAWVFDDLFADWGTLTTRVLYRKARELGLKVVLVGEGADEIFGGYPIFGGSAPDGSLLRTARVYRRYVGQRWGGTYPQFRRIFRGLAEEVGDSGFEAIRLFELRHQLPANFVMKVDKASMSASVEARAPYLDRRVADIALGTPREWLLRSGTEKYLLRQVARSLGVLPEQTVTRRKVGGSIAPSWMTEGGEFREFAREIVLRPGGWAGRLGLTRQLSRFFSGEETLPLPNRVSLPGSLAWKLLLLELWSRHYGVEEVV